MGTGVEPPGSRDALLHATALCDDMRLIRTLLIHICSKRMQTLRQVGARVTWFTATLTTCMGSTSHTRSEF